MTKQVISVVVPVYNNKPTLNELSNRILKTMESTSHPFEVLFVNDGSFDGSTETLDAIAAQNKNVRVLHLAGNYGQSEAIQAGFDYAKGDWVLFIDADLQYEPEQLADFVEKLQQGYEALSGRRLRRNDPWSRRLPSICLNIFVSLISRGRVHDLGCSMNAVSADHYRKLVGEAKLNLFTKLKIAKYLYGTELWVKHNRRPGTSSSYGLIDLLGLLRYMFPFSQPHPYQILKTSRDEKDINTR